MQFSIPTPAVLHHDVADLLRLKVPLCRADVVDHEGDLPQSTEDPFAQEDENLFEELFFDDGFVV